MMSFPLILENVRHDLRASDGKLAILTQAALLFFLLTLSLTSASIQQYLSKNLTQMLGSDMVLEQHDALTPAQEANIRAIAPKVSKTELVGITLTFGSNWERVQLKLVDDAYPLQGTLMIGSSPAAEQREAIIGPAIGDIWLGPRLATKLRATIGDHIALAGTAHEVTAILFHEPDRIMEGHSVAYRAMINADSAAPGAFKTSGRRQRFLIEADTDTQKSLELWAKENLPAATLIKKQAGQHPLAGFWKRTENFLGLASVILFFMAAVAMDMTNRRWLVQMRYRLSLYSSFGIRTGTVLTMAGLQWFTGFLLSLGLGGMLTAVAYHFIVGELQAYFPGLTGTWSGEAIGKTVLLTFGLLLALQVPALIQLKRASILDLIRNAPEGSYSWLRLLWGLIAVSALAAAYSDNLLLTGLMLGAIGMALVLMIVLTWATVAVGDKWGAGRPGFLPFAFFFMRQRLFAKSAQVLGLGLCALLLLFTLMLMRDLSGMIKSYSRQHDGNLLVSEAQSDQMADIEAWAKKTDSSIKQMRPFVSAKLIQVNNLALADYMQKPSDTLSALKRPIRLSWSEQMPANNTLSGGTWWPNDTRDWQQISTEPEVMTDLALSYGDTLTYLIDGRSYSFTLVASHSYKPGGSSITFWFQVPAKARAQIKTNTRFMGSMELPETAWGELTTLWQQHPTLSLVPLRELTERLDKMLAIIIKLTSGYAAMVLLLALFVLVASSKGFEADDQRKNGLLMSMGLRRSDCLKLSLYDWAITAVIAAVGAIAGTWIAGQLIYEAQFGLTYKPDPLWIGGTISLMVTVVCGVGVLTCMRSLSTSVQDLLAA